MASVIDIAKYFVHLSYNAGEPEPITTLKLQKLLYYGQGLSLAQRRTKLFTDKIKAWKDGPVVPLVWHEYKEYKSIPCETGPVDLSIEERVFLRQVWSIFGKYTGDELSKMTHDERPWKNARGMCAPDAKSDVEITPESLLEYFSDQDIRLPEIPKPITIKRGREVYRIEDAAKVLPVGI